MSLGTIADGGMPDTEFIIVYTVPATQTSSFTTTHSVTGSGIAANSGSQPITLNGAAVTYGFTSVPVPVGGTVTTAVTVTAGAVTTGIGAHVINNLPLGISGGKLYQPLYRSYHK